MSEPVKLINENFEFNPAALEFMNDASTNYLVVGVIGLYYDNFSWNNSSSFLYIVLANPL